MCSLHGHVRERGQGKVNPLRDDRKEKIIMKNLFKLISEEELEVRNENLEENIDEKDELITDVNNIDANLDEALLFF